MMRKFVRGFLDAYPLSEKERTLMVLGVDEACTNIIRHAYHLRDDQLISLSLEGLRNCIRMRLRDYGKQTAARSLQGRSHDLIKPGGLGGKDLIVARSGGYRFVEERGVEPGRPNVILLHRESALPIMRVTPGEYAAVAADLRRVDGAEQAEIRIRFGAAGRGAGGH